MGVKVHGNSRMKSCTLGEFLIRALIVGFVLSLPAIIIHGCCGF